MVWSGGRWREGRERRFDNLIGTVKVDIDNNQSKRCLDRQGNNNNTTERQSNTTQLA